MSDVDRPGDDEQVCQVCFESIPHEPFEVLNKSNRGDCIGAIVESLAGYHMLGNDYGCVFCCCYEQDYKKHDDNCVWRRAVYAMKEND